jgi:hypothetical protein
MAAAFGGVCVCFPPPYEADGASKDEEVAVSGPYVEVTFPLDIPGRVRSTRKGSF